MIAKLKALIIKLDLFNFSHFTEKIASLFNKFYLTNAYVLINQNLCKFCSGAKQCIGESYLSIFERISTNLLPSEVSFFLIPLSGVSKRAPDKLCIDSLRVIGQVMHRSFFEKPENNLLTFPALKVKPCIGGRLCIG